MLVTEQLATARKGVETSERGLQRNWLECYNQKSSNCCTRIGLQNANPLTGKGHRLGSLRICRYIVFKGRDGCKSLTNFGMAPPFCDQRKHTMTRPPFPENLQCPLLLRASSNGLARLIVFTQLQDWVQPAPLLKIIFQIRICTCCNKHLYHLHMAI